MSQQNIKQSSKQKSLRKIVKILSKVSNVDTAEIRQEIRKQQTSKNKNRIKHHVEKDSILNPKKQTSLPNMVFTHKLFEDRGNRVASIKQKKIESQAELRKVNFQFRKLQIKKQKIAKKHHLSEEKYKSVPHLIVPRIQQKDLKNLCISQIFQNAASSQLQSPNDKKFMKKVKLALYSSRNRVKSLYQCLSINALSSTSRHYLTTNPQLEQSKVNQSIFDIEDSKIGVNQSQGYEQNGLTKIHSIIVKKQDSNRQRKKKSLIDLIQMSRIRSENKEQKIDQMLTRKEVKDINATKIMINSLREDIDRQNKLRESIIFGGLKKLLYGDRRGRFIQENTFKTRLQGQNSPQYLKILKQQEGILQSFQGSVINRRKLAEKFSNILGVMNKHEKNVHQQKYKY